MTPTLADYIREGRSLGADERLEAAHQLLLSVESDEAESQEDIDTEWDNVIHRRVAEVLSDKARLVDGAAEHTRIRAEVTAKRG